MKEFQNNLVHLFPVSKKRGTSNKATKDLVEANGNMELNDGGIDINASIKVSLPELIIYSIKEEFGIKINPEIIEALLNDPFLAEAVYEAYRSTQQRLRALGIHVVLRNQGATPTKPLNANSVIPFRPPSANTNDFRQTVDGETVPFVSRVDLQLKAVKEAIIAITTSRIETCDTSN